MAKNVIVNEIMSDSNVYGLIFPEISFALIFKVPI